MNMPIKSLQQLILRVLRKRFTGNDARMIAEVVLYGELSGHTTHGIMRLVSGELAMLDVRGLKKPAIVKQTPLSSLIIQRRAPGMLIAVHGMHEALRLAARRGVGIVGTQGSLSSSGSLAYYAAALAQRGFVSIIMAQSTPTIAPFGAAKPIFGTNPIAFGMPAYPYPLVFDMATSAITYGDILKAGILRAPLPAHTAINRRGKPTTNPAEALRGALLPFDRSHKGSGLAMMVELLAGLWPGASFGNNRTSRGWGNLIIAMQPQLLMPLPEFRRNVAKLLRTLKHARTATGAPLRIPGEHAQAVYQANLRRGSVKIENKLLEKLQQLAK